MDQPKSLTIPGVGKALRKLADTIGDCVGYVAGPERIRALALARAEATIVGAQADADALLVTAKAEAAAQDLAARAVDRIKAREIRRQRNVEAIAEEAKRALPSDDQIADAPVDEDWTDRFFAESQDVSNGDMQRLWGKILAGEVSKPGTFSPRTLRLVKDLTTSECRLFGELTKTAWFFPQQGYVPIVHDLNRAEFREADISFATLSHLDDAGLIQFKPTEGFAFKHKININNVMAMYCGQPQLFHRNGSKDFPLGHAMFTRAGEELINAVAEAGNDKHFRGAIDYWRSAGWLHSRPSGSNPLSPNQP